MKSVADRDVRSSTFIARSILLGTFFKTGLVMDGLEELYFDEADAIKERPESSANYTQIPAIMALRFRKL